MVSNYLWRESLFPRWGRNENGPANPDMSILPRVASQVRKLRGPKTGRKFSGWEAGGGGRYILGFSVFDSLENLPRPSCSRKKSSHLRFEIAHAQHHPGL